MKRILAISLGGRDAYSCRATRSPCSRRRWRRAAAVEVAVAVAAVAASRGGGGFSPSAGGSHRSSASARPSSSRQSVGCLATLGQAQAVRQRLPLDRQVVVHCRRTRRRPARRRLNAPRCRQLDSARRPAAVRRIAPPGAVQRLGNSITSSMSLARRRGAVGSQRTPARRRRRSGRFSARRRDSNAAAGAVGGAAVGAAAAGRARADAGRPGTAGQNLSQNRPESN